MKLNKQKGVRFYLKTLFILCFVCSFVFSPVFSFSTSATGGTMTKIAIFAGEGINEHYAFRGSGRNFRASDIDEDGYPDIIVGARHHSPDGGVYIFKASTNLVDKNASSADIILRNYNAADGHLLGADIAVGDIDDDDINELIIGDYSYSSYAGGAFIFETGASFVSTTTTSTAVRITGTASSYSSSALGMLGDVNGDGYKDFAYNGGILGGGKIYVFYGSSSFTNKNVSQADIVFTDDEGGGCPYGPGYASEANLNNDAYKDIIIGCQNNSANGGNGKIYIFYGGPSLTNKNLSQADVILSAGSSSIWLLSKELMTADLNNDGYEDIITKDDHEVYIFNGSATWTNKTTNEADVILWPKDSETSSLLKGGLDIADINNDGYLDVITTAYYSSDIYVFYGSAMGITTQYASNADLIYDGTSDGSTYLGEQIETGDFDKDGNLEIVATDPNYSSSRGAVFVFTPNYSTSTISTDNDGGIVGRTITGTVTDTGTVGGVEYSIDSGTWINTCAADDGSFNSTSEDYTCTLLSSVAAGSHTIRIRSKNADGLYMLSASYASASVTMDATAPIITLTGTNPQTITLGSAYPELGATALDTSDGSVTTVPSGSVDSMILGNHTITYTATDFRGNATTTTRTITVIYSGGGTQTGSTSISTPTPTPSPSITPTPIPTPTPTPTITPTPTDPQSILNSLLQQLANLQQQLANQQAGSTHYQFTHGLQYGDTGEDVTQLQIFLKNQGTDIYPEGLVTGYFGTLTQKAVQRFQVKYNIAKSGDAGYGYVGPKTREKINSL